MNKELLLALLGLALAVGVVVLWLRGRQRRAAPSQQPAPPAPMAPAAGPAQHQPPQAAQARPQLDGAAAQVDAQRQAATEALRLARQRKAEEASRLQAERADQARAEAAARAQPRPPLPTPQRPPQPARPPQTVQPAVQPPAVVIPLPLPAPVAHSSPVPQPAPVHGTPAPRPPLVPWVPLVLVADDSKVVRVKTSRLLEKQGWQVLVAEDGAAALQALDSHAPDLLITDVEMPGLDGFELTRRVRAHPRFSRLPVIMITSSDERHRAEADAAGVNLLMGKPYAEETLLAQVQLLLASAAQRSGAGLVLH